MMSLPAMLFGSSTWAERVGQGQGQVCCFMWRVKTAWACLGYAGAGWKTIFYASNSRTWYV